VQYEVVVPAGDRKWIELDRSEAAEDLQHRVGSSVEGTCRCEQLAGDEETPGGVGGDFQGRQTRRQEDCFARIAGLCARFFAW
jgi:hypothetical protein